MLLDIADKRNFRLWLCCLSDKLGWPRWIQWRCRGQLDAAHAVAFIDTSGATRPGRFWIATDDGQHFSHASAVESDPAAS